MAEGGAWIRPGPNLSVADGWVDLGRCSDVIVSPGSLNDSEAILTDEL